MSLSKIFLLVASALLFLFLFLFIIGQKARSNAWSGVAGFVRAHALSKRRQADWLIADAGKKLGGGNPKENLRLLNEAARIDPTNSRVWSRLCEGYQFTEEFDLAIAACKRNVDTRGDGIDYNSLGLAYMAKRDYPNAALAFEKAVKKSPEGILYGNFVWSLESAHQYDKAITAAEQWVELSTADPSDLTMALENLGAIWVKLGRMDKAKESFAKVHGVDSKLNIKTCELKTDGMGNVGVGCSESP